MLTLGLFVGSTYVVGPYVVGLGHFSEFLAFDYCYLMYSEGFNFKSLQC